MIDLTTFGYSNNEQKIYETLVSQGESSSGSLVSLSGVVTSQTFRALAKLIQNELISFRMYNGRKLYRALPPYALVSFQEEQRKMLHNFVVNFPKGTTQESEASIESCEGVYSFKHAFVRHSKKLRMHESVDIIAYSYASFSEDLNTFFAQLDEQLITKKCRVRMLIEKRLLPYLKEERSDFKKYLQIRTLSPEYFSPLATNISNHEVLLSTYGKHPTVITLRDEKILKSYRKNFELLWAKGK